MKKKYVKPTITVVGMESEGFICSGSNEIKAAWGNSSEDWHNEGHDNEPSISTDIEDDYGTISSQSKRHRFSSWDSW